MLSSSRRGIQYPNPNRSDTPDVPRDFGAVITALDVDVYYGQGTLASRPTSTPGSPGVVGRVYFATDTSPMTLYWDYGTGWQSIGAVFAGSIGTTELADNAVTQAKMADASVGTAELVNQGVTIGKLDPTIPFIPVGAVMDWPWASGSIPSWAALPSGQNITNVSHPTLHALAVTSGYPHGGSGNNANLPDYRGRSGVGKDDMGGTAANRITLAVSGFAGTTLGAVGGAQSIALVTAELPAHNHALTGAPSVGSLAVAAHNHGGGSHAHTASDGRPFATYYSVGSSDGSASVNGGADIHVASASISASGTIIASEAPAVTGAPGIGSLASSNTGSDTAHRNVQPTIIVNKMMRVL